MPRLIVRAGIQEIYSIRYVKQQWFDLFGGCNEVSMSYRIYRDWKCKEIIDSQDPLVSGCGSRPPRFPACLEMKWSPEKISMCDFRWRAKSDILRIVFHIARSRWIKCQTRTRKLGNRTKCSVLPLCTFEYLCISDLYHGRRRLGQTVHLEDDT